MKTLFTMFAFVGLASLAVASRDRFTKIVRADLIFEADDKVILLQDRTNIQGLTFQTGSSVAEVPKVDLAGISSPKIESMAVLFGAYTSGELAGVKYHYLRFSFGAESEKAFGEFPSVSFFFHDGKYHHREIKKKVAEGSWQTSGPRGGGTTSVLKAQ